MDVQRATQIVEAVVAGRKRWENSYGTGEFSVGEITEAMLVLHSEGKVLTQDHSDALTKVKRQLTASKAREAKLKKQVKALKNQVDHMATSRKEAGVD